jgi:hypothetical protein
MNANEKRLREVLAGIAETASVAAGGEQPVDDHAADAPSPAEYGCAIKSLPARLLVKAAQHAVGINPINAPALGTSAQVTADSDVDEPLRIAVLTAKYWGASPRQLTVSFMETAPADLRARILTHMNAWGKTAAFTFVQTQGTGQVRISRSSGGYWSYLGTDVMLIPKTRQTMNLQGFTMSTPESEYKRVVRHETGHTLGFPHEHMRAVIVARIDKAKAYAYFLRTQGWDRNTVDQQVLTPLEESALISTAADQASIMCYQLPGSITKDGKPILGGLDIDQTDYAFAGRIYPKPARQATLRAADEGADDWDELEDVDLSDIDYRPTG